MKQVYNLVVVNEDMEVVFVASYLNKKQAQKALNDDYKSTKEMLKAEGWDDDSLTVDDLTDGCNYWIQYGESSYYAEVNGGTLYEEGEL